MHPIKCVVLTHWLRILRIDNKGIFIDIIEMSDDTLPLKAREDVDRTGYECMDHTSSALRESDIKDNIQLIIDGSERQKRGGV